MAACAGVLTIQVLTPALFREMAASTGVQKYCEHPHCDYTRDGSTLRCGLF